MYAVIHTGGKQYRVAVGQTLKVEKLPAEVGQAVDFEKVLFVTDGAKHTVGAPYVEGGKVVAEVVSHGRGKKVKIVKFRRRKHSRTQMGHRQDFTEIKVTDIKAA